MQPEPDHATLVDAAAALLMAAITLRDIASAMPPGVLAACPSDIADRLMSHRYQAAFDALPARTREQARQAVDADPAIIAARQIGNHHA